jgi:hypothetical protein
MEDRAVHLPPTAREVSFCIQFLIVFDSEVGQFWRVDISIRPIGLRHLYVEGILFLRRSSLTVRFRPVMNIGLESFLSDMRGVLERPDLCPIHELASVYANVYTISSRQSSLLQEAASAEAAHH